MFDPKLKEALGRVQKPGRYTGGEPGSIYKEKDKVDVRFAFCFPDTYEVGMSHLGMKLLYGLFNEQPDVWCERVFAPDVNVLSGRKDPVRAAQQPRKLVVRARLYALAGYEGRDGAPAAAAVHHGEQGPSHGL